MTAGQKGSAMKVLGIIPARGGSKGVPRKNIRALGGMPLLAYTVNAAAASALARTIVSTDDEEIAAVARAAGGDVPFLRPATLATDSAGAIDTLQHALAATEDDDGVRYDAVMMLQPTTPFRKTADIDEALARLERTGADSVISVIDVEGHHPARMKYLAGDQLIDPAFGEARENQPRQELRAMYLRNGAIYLCRREILESGSLKGRDCRAQIMPLSRSVNIDTEMDFRYAAWLLENDFFGEGASDGADSGSVGA